MGLIRLLIFAAVAFLVYSLFKRITGGVRSTVQRKRPARGTPLEGSLVQDPNCHVYVDSKDAVTRQVRGGTLFFCSEACARTYLKEEQHTSQ